MAIPTQVPERRILCVDDNEAGLRVRAMFLETLGFKVDVATNGRDALKMVTQNVPGLVILDYRMPGMDGGELATRLKRLYPQLPLLMLTGYAAEVPPEARTQVDQVVAKGAHPAELMDGIKALTRWPSHAAPLQDASTRIQSNHRHIAAVRQHLDSSHKSFPKERKL